MAIVHSVTIEDTTYPQAYSRIVLIRADKANAYIFVNTYADEAARLREDQPIRQFEPVTTLASLNGDLYTLAYEYIKTVPEFEGATDHPVADPANG